MDVDDRRCGAETQFEDLPIGAVFEWSSMDGICIKWAFDKYVHAESDSWSSWMEVPSKEARATVYRLRATLVVHGAWEDSSDA